MDISTVFSPQEIFAPGGRAPAPRVFLAPGRYVQGSGVIDRLGRYMSILGAKRAAVLVTPRGLSRDGGRIVQGLQTAGVDVEIAEFGGECSIEEITTHAEALSGSRVDVLLAVGGGKCVDAGKAIAFRLGAPVVVVPTLASNDAPCSALSVLYSLEGVSTGVEFFPCSPALVVVDTGVVAAAPARYLVAGMGDAMATWYEARICLANPAAVTTVGARPTVAACAIGEVCASTLFDKGEEAASAVAGKRVSEALEDVVEANTLLSGLGFESGGLAAAHGVAQALTAVPDVHANHLHGEMVAIGTLAQLAMEQRPDEFHRVAAFFAAVGLPVHLGQVSMDAGDDDAVDAVVEATLAFPFIGNMPMELDADRVRRGLLEAHRAGHEVCSRVGDAAYRGLHGE